MQFTSDPAFEDLEGAYQAYLEAWGTWMVEHHRGMSGATADRITSNLVTARETVENLLGSRTWNALGIDDSAALRTLRACLPDLDAWATPLDGWSFANGSNGGTFASGETGGTGVTRGTGFEDTPEAPAGIPALRRTTFDSWGAAMANLDVAGERLDRLTVTARLAREDDDAARRSLFLSMDPAWRTLNGDDEPSSPYRRLLATSAARWARDGSPIDANAAALGMEPANVEPTMRRILETFRTVALGPELVEPWNYRHVVGALGRRLDGLIQAEQLRVINDAHLRAIGADPTTLRIHYDIHPRPDRPVIPTAFTVAADVATRAADGSWNGATPWVFATYAEGGIGNLEELLHESGHALHYAAIRARPAHFVWPPDQTAFVEAIADVVGWTTHEPEFVMAHLGVEVTTRESVVARFGSVMLDAAWTLFEIELHRHPDRSPNEVWSEIAERDLGVQGHPEWSWWAGRGQLIDAPGYLANYALGAVMVAAVRAQIQTVRGDWSSGDPGWYPYVSNELLRFGGGGSPRNLLTAFLDGPLTPDTLIADIERGG